MVTRGWYMIAIPTLFEFLMIIEDESMMSNTVSKRFNDDWLVVEPPL